MALVVPLRLRKRFTLYADDTGQPDIRPPVGGERHTFAYGGVVVPNSGIANMQRRWRDIKAEFFATRDEVKATAWSSGGRTKNPASSWRTSPWG